MQCGIPRRAFDHLSVAIPRFGDRPNRCETAIPDSERQAWDR